MSANSEIDLKNDQRIQFLYEYIAFYLNISLTLFGFVLTALIFLFSINQANMTVLLDYYFRAVFLLLCLGLMFLFLSYEGYHHIKTSFIESLFSKEKGKKRDTLEMYFIKTKVNTYILLAGIVCLFAGILVLLFSLFPIGFLIFQITFASILLILILYLTMNILILKKKIKKLIAKWFLLS